MSRAVPTPVPCDPFAVARWWLELWRMVWLDGPLAWAERVDRAAAGPAGGGPVDPLQAMALGLGCDGTGEPEGGDPPSPAA